ncbi:unnamed protein product [Brassica rapa subsp. trilocularis]
MRDPAIQNILTDPVLRRYCLICDRDLPEVSYVEEAE